MARSRRLPANYFKFVNPIIISLIGVGMYLLLMAWLDPKNISTTYFGRIAEFATWLGTENNRLMKQIFLAAVAAHLCEAMVAAYLCLRRGIGTMATIAWTIQTVLFGIFSLYYLIWPVTDTKEPQKKETKAPKISKEQKEGKQNKGKKNQNKSKAKKEN